MKMKKIIFLLLIVSVRFAESSNIFAIIVPPVKKQRVKKIQRVSKRPRLSNKQLAQEYLNQKESRNLTDEGFDIFEQAMCEHDFETMRNIIAASDLESENENNFTLLIMAIFEGNKKVVQMLLEAGAKVDHEWKALTSPETISLVQVALMKGQKNCIEDLLHAGAKIPTKLTYVQYCWLQEIQDKMNAENHEIHNAFNVLRMQNTQKVHPMIQQRVSQMLMYRPKRDSESDLD